MCYNLSCILCSLTGSKSVSMEQLYEPDEEEIPPRQDEDATQVKESIALPSLTLTDQQEAELSALEQAQLNELTPPPEQQQDTAISIPEENTAAATSNADNADLKSSLKAHIEDTVDSGPTISPVVNPPSKTVVKFKEDTIMSVVHDVRIEQESGQEMIEEEVGGAIDEVKEEEPSEVNVKSQSLEPVKQDVGGATDSPSKQEMQSPQNKRKERPVYKPLFDEPPDPDDTLFGNDDTSAPYYYHHRDNIGSIALAPTPVDSYREGKTPDLSDNPLYQDSDEEEQRGGYYGHSSAGQGLQEEATEFGHRKREYYAESGRERSFLSLQPTTFDPRGEIIVPKCGGKRWFQTVKSMCRLTPLSNLTRAQLLVE